MGVRVLKLFSIENAQSRGFALIVVNWNEQVRKTGGHSRGRVNFHGRRAWRPAVEKSRPKERVISSLAQLRPDKKPSRNSKTAGVRGDSCKSDPGLMRSFRNMQQLRCCFRPINDFFVRRGSTHTHTHTLFPTESKCEMRVSLHLGKYLSFSSPLFPSHLPVSSLLKNDSF